MALPGDDLVIDPTTGYTLAISIRAAPHEVWPWLVQMGQGRAGFYTHTWIENLLGADIHNADHIVASLQDLDVGDVVRLTPDPYLGHRGQRMIVSECRRPRALVFSQTLPTGGAATWAFALYQESAHSTRLIMRRRGNHPSVFDKLMLPGYVFMDRGVMRGIRERAETSPRP